MKIFNGRWLLGLIVIFFGITLLLENLGIAEIDFQYIFKIIIPISFILWGIDTLGRKHILSGVVLLLLGISILGRNFGWYDFNLSILWELFWPVIFILIGISIITSVRPGSKNNLAIMGSVEKNKTHWRVESDTYTTIMGGIDLDLRMAEIPEGETNLKLTAIMGGVEIIVPQDITVNCKGNVILGGLELLDRSTGGILSSLQAEQLGNSKVVNIQCTAIMGGIEIKSSGNFKGAK